MIHALRELELERKALQVRAAVQRVSIVSSCESIAVRLSPAQDAAVLARPVLMASIAGLLIWATRKKRGGWLARAALLIGIWGRLSPLLRSLKNK